MQKKTKRVQNFADLKNRLNLTENSDTNSTRKSKIVKVYSSTKEYGETKYEVDLTEILDNRSELAYKEACENRRFEIQMYWHRAAYFWAFIVSIYTAFFFISGNDGEPIIYKEVIKLALAFLGFMFCIGFYFANKGSKVWQENWEIHEGLLEDEVAVKLYKTFQYDKTKDYSVSKINDWLCGILSVFSFVFFAIMLAHTIQDWFKCLPFVIKIFMFVFTIFLVMIFLHIAKKSVSGNSFGNKEIKFKKVDYNE